jgi:hypothetical protein
MVAYQLITQLLKYPAMLAEDMQRLVEQSELNSDCLEP